VLSYCHKALHWLEKLYWQKLAAVCNQHCWPEIAICGYWDLGTGSLLEPTVVAHNSDAVKELLNGGHGVGYDSFGEIRLPNSISCKFGLKFFLCHFDRCKLRHGSRYGFHLSLHLNVSFLCLHLAFVHFASHTVHLFAAKQDLIPWTVLCLFWRFIAFIVDAFLPITFGYGSAKLKCEPGLQPTRSIFILFAISCPKFHPSL
jgi:hypothetical protein